MGIEFFIFTEKEHKWKDEKGKKWNLEYGAVFKAELEIVKALQL